MDERDKVGEREQRDRETKDCPVCRGRGYLRCDCWPGDCICGEDDRDCENCHGDGIIWVDEDECL